MTNLKPSFLDDWGVDLSKRERERRGGVVEKKKFSSFGSVNRMS